MEKNIEKQIKQFRRLRQKAQEKGNRKEEAEAVNFLGELHSKLGDYDESLQLHKSELQLCKTLVDKIGEAVAHRKIGECYASLGDYTKALQHQYKHLELGKVANSLAEQQRAFATIGRTYLLQGEDFHNDENFDEAKPLLIKAEEAFKSSIRFSQSIQEAKTLPEKEVHLMKCRGISNLAYVYHFLSIEEGEDFQGNYSKQSLALYKKALLISQKRMLSDETHRVQLQLSMFYRSRGRSDDAVHHAEEAIRSAKVARNTTWHIEGLAELGSIQFEDGNCDGARKSFKKCYRIAQDSETKSVYREKLKSVVKILSLQRKAENFLTPIEKFKAYEKIADKFCDVGCYKAAIENYQKQENMFAELESLSNQQRATVYFSLGLTNSDLNDHKKAIEYFYKELELYSDPKELAKTWTQIGISTEKLSDVYEAEGCHKKAVEYAEQTEDTKLQLKSLNLLLDLQEKLRSPDAPETREKLSDLQLKSGILFDVDENSEDICKDINLENAIESDGSEDLMEKELASTSAGDSDSEETRKSRMTTKVWTKKSNEKGETPLHRACIEGCLKRVRLRLEQKHPINVPDNAGWTPLHEACNHGYSDIVTLLLDHGANIDQKAACGTTSMQDAASAGHFDIVSILLDKGASTSMRNNQGDNALSCLEKYYEAVKEDMSPSELDEYQTVRAKLQSLTENIKHKDDENLGRINDIFDAEVCTQENTDNTEFSQLSGLTLSMSQNNPKTLRNSIKNQVKDNLNPDETKDCIFMDDLPSFTTRSLKSNPQVGAKESILNAADEYRSVMAQLGGSDALSKFSHQSTQSRAPKRPLNPTGLVSRDDYVGDDWLIEDDIEANSSSRITENRPKRTKTGTPKDQSRATTTRGQQYAKRTTESNSGAFTSSFLNHDRINQKSSKFSSQKISDFFTEQDELITIEDDTIPASVPIESNCRKSVPHVIKSPIALVQQPSPTTQIDPCRIRIDINGKRFQVGVPEKTRTIGWLCERAAHCYKQNNGMYPILSLYSGENEEDACLLSNDDVIFDVLRNNELITAKVVTWKIASLAQQYEEYCISTNQAVHPLVLTACRLSSTTGKLLLKNKGLSNNRLMPLIVSMTQQKLESIHLDGNILGDVGVSELCKSLEKQLSLTTPLPTVSLLTELSLRCTNMTSQGIKEMSKVAALWSLKNLQILDLSCNRLSDCCSGDFPVILQNCPSLQTLSMSQCRLTSKFFQNNHLEFKAAMSECINLSHLDVSHNAIGSVGCELLLKSLPHYSVTKLNLSGICDAHNSLITRHIASYVRKDGCVLNTLRCAENHLNFTQLQIFISELPKKSSLKELDISKNCLERSKLYTLLRSVEGLTKVAADHDNSEWSENLTVARAKRSVAMESSDDIIREFLLTQMEVGE